MGDSPGSLLARGGGGDINIMVTHIGFDGVVNNDGSEVESVLKPNKFSRFTRVLVGHYHNASKLGENVYYTGSVYQNNFGEDITFQTTSNG
jgi:DNA repair exonuclease SbcCD nuclease subunit